MTIRVLVVDDDALVRAGLTMMLTTFDTDDNVLRFFPPSRPGAPCEPARAASC